MEIEASVSDRDEFEAIAIEGGMNIYDVTAKRVGEAYEVIACNIIHRGVNGDHDNNRLDNGIEYFAYTYIPDILHRSECNTDYASVSVKLAYVSDEESGVIVSVKNSPAKLH
jgi:hypothetical protein